MKKKFLQQLLDYAKLEFNQKVKKEKLCKNPFFEDLDSWDIEAIYNNCTIKDGKLYNEKGVMLSTDGACMNERVPYFINQSTGYCGDDYYGTMFVNVGNGVFVAVNY